MNNKPQNYPQHWQPNVVNETDPNMVFCVETLFSIMSFECDCHICTAKKGMAANALNWLVGQKLGIAEISEMLHGQYVQGQEEEFDPVPQEVVDLCRRHIQLSRTSERVRGVLSGWLEHIGA